MNPRSILGCAWLMLIAQTGRPEGTPTAGADYAVRSYKTVGADSRVMHVVVPKGAAVKRPAAVLFHGGGFVWGGPDATDGPAREYGPRHRRVLRRLSVRESFDDHAY